MAEINKYPVLSREEEHKLAMRYRKKRDLEAARKLITSNLRFVVKIANEYKGYGLNLMDLIQEGNIGLMQSVKRFDPRKWSEPLF
jgi:RNA polymerase sigma-32 factor